MRVKILQRNRENNFESSFQGPPTTLYRFRLEVDSLAKVSICPRSSFFHSAIGHVFSQNKVSYLPPDDPRLEIWRGQSIQPRLSWPRRRKCLFICFPVDPYPLPASGYPLFLERCRRARKARTVERISCHHTQA